MNTIRKIRRRKHPEATEFENTAGSFKRPPGILQQQRAGVGGFDIAPGLVSRLSKEVGGRMAVHPLEVAADS